MRLRVINTEFSFKKCFLHMRDVHQYVINGAICVADYDNTFGHVPLEREAKKHGFKPVYGVRLRVSRPENEKRRTGHVYTTFIANNTDGLKALYELVEKAYEQFYYFPRLYTRNLVDLHPGITNLGEHVGTNAYGRARDREVYELLAGARRSGKDGYSYNFDARCENQCIDGAIEVESVGTATIPRAAMVKWKGDTDIRGICRAQLRHRVEDVTQEYTDRLKYEVGLIIEKDYVDYFMIVADMVKFAKRTMLVGPSRGSSAGSLVCYLLGITEVDPVKHGLIFERFIDINRFDLPDIDIDFPDKKREEVFKYLVRKYGRANVRSIATINRLMPKSAIGEFAQGLGIPAYETAAVKDAIIERSGGDARAAMCIGDTFDTTDPGRDFIAKYPKMRLCGEVEGHAAHAGKHAAGIVVSTLPITTYSGINSRDDVMMMDKDDAEYLGLLKIDCLGLRTLSILEDTVKQIPRMRLKDVYSLPLDNQKAIKLFNDMRLSGIFQFEGYALQSLTRQMGIRSFGDIVAITSLARPGALNSGGAGRYVKYHTGIDTPRFFNEIHEAITGDTYGITVFQEQMMEIARHIGKFSWKDVQVLRKAASKSYGDEFFGKYRDKFVSGAESTGLSPDDAIEIWNDISHSGSWSFNKSHAVSYGLISYWTAYFKANYPLEFATASLNNARDDDHAIKLLRDMVQNDGIKYKPIDTRISGINWEVHDGVLVGGLINVKGIGEKKAKQFIAMREGKKPPTPSFWKMMEDPATSFDILFPTTHYWGQLFHSPRDCGLNEAPVTINTIKDPGEYMFVGCLVDRNLRDLNEYVFLKKRGGKTIDEDNLYLNLTVEDDTDSIICTINRYRYEEMGREIAETGKVGESWYLITGRIRGDWRKIDVTAIHNLSNHDWSEV